MMKSLRRLGSDLGFDTPRGIGSEFYNIDMSYYRITAPVQTQSGKVLDYNWDLEVAIEHENDTETWFYEFVKLVHICCGLKVIITYHNYSNYRFPLEEKFTVLTSLYAMRSYKQTRDKWLLIFGPTFNCLGDYDYVGYRFTGSQPILLETVPILPVS
jgi:hypothetical protein